MAEDKAKKIKLVKPIIVAGEHAPAGSVHSLPRHKADEIIGAGCAVPADDGDTGDESDEAPGLRTEKPKHGDPTPRHGDPDPSKRTVPAKK
jgi:hypothetical protein